MNAREAMQALLDGKTIRREDVGVETILRMDGISLVQTYDGFVTRRVLTGFEVVEEYPLTFEQALTAMLDGKVVMCEKNKWYAYRFHNGRFEDSHENNYFTKWEECSILATVQKGKWKVVE